MGGRPPYATTVDFAAASDARVAEAPPADALNTLAAVGTLAPSAPHHRALDEDDAVLEISSETVEVDIDDVDEALLVASEAPPHAAAFTMPIVAPPPMVPSASGVGELPPPFADELEEVPPSSSRRAVASERPEAYGVPSPPLHTPPPESGQQVSVAPAAAVSEPPDSLEDHTLIGGWREPGLGVPHVGSGVRVPAPVQHREPAVAVAPTVHLAPDVTRPERLAEGASVAEFAGALPIPKPTTLGELLDLTLSL